MPPKSKRIKNRTPKENIFITTKATQKSVCNNVKAPRKALSDKTNSASDDNDPLPSPNPKPAIQTRRMVRTKNVSSTNNKKIKVGSNRNQKLPESLSENQSLKFNGNKSTSAENQTVFQKESVMLEPLQVCVEEVETNIADSRPKRMRRLPSKFENHFISPSKCVPVQPINASTPVVRNKDLKICSEIDNEIVKSRSNRNLKNLNTKTMLIESSKDSSSIGGSSSSYNSSTEKPKRNMRSTKCKPVMAIAKKPKAIKVNTVLHKKQADTNNNANDSNREQNLCYKSPSCKDVNKVSMNRIINKDYSFRLFDEQRNTKKRNSNNLDVYEFTYDPAQEPPPQKRKRKRIVKKKQEKPKPVFKSTYDKNVAKSLTALKNVLSKKSEAKLQTGTPTLQTSQNKPTVNINDNMKNVPQNANHVENGLQQNFNSFNVEDLVLNDLSIANHYNDINYSPVNSPDHVRQPSEPRNDICPVKSVPTNTDPLNIQDDLSFFDDHPVACSSMNMSTRNPLATPWRAEFEQLPIKWQVNTYVKPNMTPALESSFINFDNKKKHVYTNIVPEDNEPLPEIIDTESASKLKQTSIISFFKEVVERQTNKKSKFKTTPVKVDSALANNQNTSQALLVASNSINKNITPQKMASKITPSVSDLYINDKENSIELQAAQTNSPLSSKAKQQYQSEKKNKNITFFGFDESEEQENVSPVKVIDKHQINAMRPRSRAVLQEFNLQTGPTRLPLGTKNKKDKNANINKVFDEAMETADQNLCLEKANEISKEANNTNNVIEECNINLCPEDSQSVHLFEDLELIHHFKPPRKSYTKAKKVVFRQHSESSDTQDGEIQNQRDADSSAEEDNLDDLTFEIPTAQTKRQRKKKKTNKQRARKEEKEVEEWAAGFNSMCDDIDHFDLIVE